MRAAARTLLVLFCVFATLSIQAADKAVTGYWASDGSVLHITETNGNLSARVVALLNPTYLPDEDFGPVGAVRRDDLNPDESLRTKTVLGLELLSNYTHNGKRWEGKIYDPESGNTYSSRMEVDRSGNLKMRGYIGVPMLGRTAIFEPLSQCKAHMQEMLKLTPTFSGPSC